MIETLIGVVLDGTGSTNHLIQRIHLARGEHATLNLEIVHQDGTPFDLTGFSVVLRIPKLAITRGGEVLDEVLGRVFFELVNADTLTSDAGDYSYFAFIWDDVTSAGYCVIPSSLLRLTEDQIDTGETITTVSAAQRLVGMPSPLPSYNVRPYFFAGTWRLQQYERAKATFASSAQATVSWPSFESRPFEVRAGAARITSGSASVVVDVENVTPTGCLVQLSDAITGEVDLEIEEVLS